MKFSIYQESRQGPRKSNQDRVAYCYSRDALCMVIADGMGGHLHGEVAAQIATQFIAEAFQREAQPRIADPFKFLLDSITSAHHAIVDYANVRSLLETPRTTCVACIIQDGIAHWAHVGDSRLYLIRNGKVEAQTKDHSRVQILVDADSQRIVGATILGIEGDEAIHTIVDIMYADVPYTVLERAVHAHPTVSELIPTVLGSLQPLAAAA